MLRKPLPVVISLPQSGTGVPPELRACLNPDAGVLPDPPDAVLKDVFAFERGVAGLLIPETAAWYINPGLPLSLALPDRTPDHQPLYRTSGCFPKKIMVERYYHAYFKSLEQAGRRARAGLECRLLPDEDGECTLALYNLGDACGEAEQGRTTCRPSQLRDLRDIVAARFVDIPGRVLLNPPAAGHEIIRRLGTTGQPWIGLGLSPRLVRAGISPDPINLLRSRLETVLSLWCRLEEWV